MLEQLGADEPTAHLGWVWQIAGDVFRRPVVISGQFRRPVRDWPGTPAEATAKRLSKRGVALTHRRPCLSDRAVATLPDLAGDLRDPQLYVACATPPADRSRPPTPQTPWMRPLLTP
jgi:hypothetical protein